jgi:hypothetical protein
LTERNVTPQEQIGSSTTIQLVNRILRNIGQPDVAAIDSENRSAMALDHLNAAARAHFDDHGWDFLVRHDGYLRLRPAFTQSWVAITNVEMSDGTTRGQVIPTGISQQADVAYDNVGAYSIITDDTKWDNMVSKIVGLSRAGDPPAALISMTWEHPWHTSGLVSTDTNNLDVIFPEYILGSEVHSVTGARYQQEELSLVFADPDDTFDRAVPSPNTRRGPPEMLIVGGLGTETARWGTSARETLGALPDPGLRCFVWPIPDDDYLVNFSYTREFKALTDPAAMNPVTTFPGVPENTLDKIVDRATATMMMKVPTSSPQLGAANISLYREAAERAARANRPDKGRRFSLKSLDRVGRSRHRRKQTFGELDLDG